ncbi:MAG: creatininase family protein, partial [Bacteroidales bacterium]|nr:creatininase family protein [Bacteroidales bacterium]
MSPFDLSAATWGEVRKQDHYDWAILPWGSTEPHNYHLPYGTDVICS